MTVIATTPMLPGVCYVLAAICTVIGLIVVRREFGRRLVALVVIGGVWLVPVPLSADDDEDFLIAKAKCELYEPWSADWILRGCWRYTAGGDPPLSQSAPAPQPTTAPKPPTKKKT